MWKACVQSQSDSRIIKLLIEENSSLISFSSFIRLLCNSADFRYYFSQELSSIPFSAFRWETPPVTNTSIDRDFECVAINSPGLSRKPDPDAFSEYFTSHAIDRIAVFPNLGKDAIMVVPCPVSDYSAYGHIAAFLRYAPEAQQHCLWKAVGREMVNRLSSTPIWLNTAGGGVPWLHIRLDSYPKYYNYLPYTEIFTKEL